MKSPTQIAIEALTRYDEPAMVRRSSMAPDEHGEYLKRADVLAALTPPAQGSIDADRLPPWPDYGIVSGTLRGFTGEQMNAYALADRAARQSAAPGDGTPITGLGSMTFEESEEITLRFKDFHSAHQFMLSHSPTVGSDDMPPRPAPAPSEPVPQGVQECAVCEDEGMVWIDGCTQACVACQDITDDSAAAPTATTATSGGEAVEVEQKPAAWMNPSEGWVKDAFIWQQDAREPQFSVPVYLAPPPLPATDAASDDHAVAMDRQYLAGYDAGFMAGERGDHLARAIAHHNRDSAIRALISKEG